MMGFERAAVKDRGTVVDVMEADRPQLWVILHRRLDDGRAVYELHYSTACGEAELRRAGRALPDGCVVASEPRAVEPESSDDILCLDPDGDESELIVSFVRAGA